MKYIIQEPDLVVSTSHYYTKLEMLTSDKHLNLLFHLFQPKIKSLMMHFIILDLLNQNSLKFQTEHSAQTNCNKVNYCLVTIPKSLNVNQK